MNDQHAAGLGCHALVTLFSADSAIFVRNLINFISDTHRECMVAKFSKKRPDLLQLNWPIGLSIILVYHRLDYTQILGRLSRTDW